MLLNAINTSYFNSCSISHFSGDFCVCEYNEDSVIDLEKAMEISSIRKRYESEGIRKFVTFTHESVKYSKEASQYFGEPSEYENIHFMAVVVQNTPKYHSFILNFLYKFKTKKITTVYFNDYKSALEWIKSV